MNLSKHRIALATGLPGLLNWYLRKHILVVTYHGLYDGPIVEGRFPDTFIHIDQMAEQLRFLNKKYRVLKPDELLQAIKNKKALPDHAALVTFDDGYANFHRLAVPVLKKLDIQPIVFVPTYYVEKQTPFWYDLVWLYFQYPPRLNIEQLNQKLNIQADRAQLLERYLKTLKGMNRDSREDIIRDIQAAINENGVDPGNKADDFKALTVDQLRELSKQGIWFGGHTHSHTIMTSMVDGEARDEIELNKSILEDWLGRQVHFFAYPNGGKSDFGQRHRQMIKEVGYTAAFSLTQQRVSLSGDPMSISRLHIPPEDTLDSFRFRCTGILPLIGRFRGRRKLA